MAMTQRNLAVLRFGGTPLEVLQQEGHPVPVRGAGPSVSGRPDPRRSVQDVDFQPGVVGQGGQAAGCGVGDGLDAGVLLEGVPRFLHLDSYTLGIQRGEIKGHSLKES